MSFSFVARQPILDDDQHTFGYELLFRNSEQNCFPQVDGDFATANLIVQNHLSHHLDVTCCNKKAFINFNEHALLNNYPLFFDSEELIVEVLETVPASTEIKQLLISLSDKGYALALDDLPAERLEDWADILQHISYIKIDIEDHNKLELLKIANKVKSEYSHITLLAERVEEFSQFEYLRNMGYKLFQGYFFGKPEMVKNKQLSPAKVNLLKITEEVFQPKIDFNRVAELISTDLNLTVGLLKLVNSAANGLKVEIETLKQAITFLGEEKLKQFISIMVVSEMGKDQCEELVVSSTIIGRLMHLLCEVLDKPKIKIEAFLTGMLSNLEAILRLPAESVYDVLPLPASVRLALEKREGELGELLQMAEYIEFGVSERGEALVDQAGLNNETLNSLAFDAHKWYLDINRN